MSEIKITPTSIPGLLVIDIPLHEDSRGWFKENWQDEKLRSAGLPIFNPIQNNISYNSEIGVTRGIHAEPWDKYISVASGQVFAAWVDLREGGSYGRSFWCEIGPDRAVFVPRGVGNSFQTIEAPAVYSYLVNRHWSEAAQSEYSYVNLKDPTVNVPWPIPLESAVVSEKDESHPNLEHARAVSRPRLLVVGSGGQVGRSAVSRWGKKANVDFVGREDLDLSSEGSCSTFDFSQYDSIINFSAYTQVDNAETIEGRRMAWATNVDGVARLVEAARVNNATLVHVSSDYVFDGLKKRYTEDDAVAPLSVYGQTKAAGDRIVMSLGQHYIVRTSWVIGNGNNFVDTMYKLAIGGVDPDVVGDQIGRLTFADDLVDFVEHLLRTRPATGIYNISSEGAPSSWADIAKNVFQLSGHDPARVQTVTTESYFSKQNRREGDGKTAPRPRNSVLDLDKVKGIGFKPSNQEESLRRHLGVADG